MTAAASRRGPPRDRPLPPALRSRGPRAARALHALGGAATVVVAALPVDVWPRAHGAAAAVGFGALALWPACAWVRGGSGVLRPVVAAGVATSLVGLLALFVAELQGLTPD